ncbi:hypothetical protein GCM10007424_08440 [Flavobacterium suaedae]|uniref:Uncharacterized protein n=1 Tax=Flavobacterium suaedae TaxID=1767027 RepID=A0ABQ1JMH9_9FLAO|nr:hypothetical protein [Flavobacterium suaedae]GGB70771.1 hypothetical protein GCM10007424_08440 [Flavobacterium suaedae]
MRTSLNFENLDTKKLLSELDFEFFLKQNIKDENYNEQEINQIHNSYNSYKNELKLNKKKKKQYYYLMEGKVRKMFTGGLLPALFGLDETRSHRFIDFEAVGENWAYFNYWQKYYRRKIIREKTWGYIIKLGSTLAIILSIIKLLEYFKVL